MKSDYNIFYTDDDKDDQDLFKSVIDEMNQSLSLHLHSTGDELLHAIKNPPPRPSIVFLDLNMPEKNGFEVLKELRSYHYSKQTPVVIFSTSDDSKAIAQSKDLGANMYVTKPESYEVLRGMVAHIISIDWENFASSDKSFVYRHN
ncbi:response regulator [Sediminibacterium ginsengisoli]|uniref:Response regulator receiver domain-containing protein n=1 Tax=Sediminibacterium ginsengisoli TaxID=413434 RepID=A0A1T4QCN5_9BACT|nr:response regulator [Sediminibacterium ginsengisoli]SKA01550.1 Response regulator receiver domain-containing protein [Sediminibacterium ginsengisoli]